MQKRYTIKYSPHAQRDLEKFRKRYWKSYLDYVAIQSALEIDPYGVGKPLKGNFKGFYSMSFSRKPECRVLYEIKDNLVIVFIVRIGTRENFYDIF